ncbi:uncharacterized protein N7496_006944, partial [Penicillium cataractarum]
SQIKPIYNPHNHKPSHNSPSLNALIQTLNLHPHPEGGYFTETDRHPSPPPSNKTRTGNTPESDPALRAASSTIFYLLTPNAPLGSFHRHRGRTIHTWHRGRGRYVIIHADEATCSHEGSEKFEGEEKGRLESFVVGPDVARGERLQWVVGAGKYKASYLLPDIAKQGGSEGLLISEVVVPAFDFADLDFLRRDEMEQLVTAEQVRELSWMLKVPEK